MKKKIDENKFSITVKTENNRNFKERLTKLITEFASLYHRKGFNYADLMPAIEYLLYCTYASKNVEELGIVGFEDNYKFDAAKHALGNDYVAKDYLKYFERFESAKAEVNLPELNAGILAKNADLEFISTWIEMFDDSCLSLSKDCSYSIAASIHGILRGANLAFEDKEGFQYLCNTSLATCMSALVGTADETVCDFACGTGTVVSRAVKSGARKAVINDVDPLMVERSKIAIFFANPTASIEATSDDVFVDGVPAEIADACFVQPPLGVRLINKTSANQARSITALPGLQGVEASSFKSEEYAIGLALEALKKEGTAIVHVPMRFLFGSSKSEKTTRKALIQNSFVKAVFELPAGFVVGSSISSALVVLEKGSQKARNHKVLLVDMASTYLEDQEFFEKSKFSNVITSEGIKWACDLLTEPKDVSMVAKLVSVEEFEQTDYSFIYSRYGNVFDYKKAWETTRSFEEIVSDIENEQEKLESISQDIDSMLARIASEG